MIKREIEIRLYDIDVKKIKNILKKNNAKLVQKKTLIGAILYHHPKGKKDSFIRIRDEGKQITMTIKTDLDSKYVIEREVEINSIEEGDAILTFLGCKKKYQFQKFRETWSLKGCKEIVFDAHPGMPTYMEIDCHSIESLKKISKLLGYNISDHSKKKVDDIYYDLYGIKLTKKQKNSIKESTFESASKNLEPHIKKNKDKFNKILKEQLSFIKKSKK